MINTAIPTLHQVRLPPKVAVLGKGMVQNNALLSNILQTQIVRHSPLSQALPINASLESAMGVIGWGNKKSYQRAKKLGKKNDLPIYSIEDGFIRSLDSGLSSRYGVSVVVDDLGIYFDLNRPSRLEQMICRRISTKLPKKNLSQPANWSAVHQQTAHRLINKIIDNQLSKYNDCLACPSLSQLANNSNEHILLIDQVAGDGSITGACGSQKVGKQQFVKLIKDAVSRHPKANIWIKAHPAGKKGYLTEMTLPKKYRQRVHVLAESVNPIALLKQVQHLYTVSSHMGFEALMLKTQGQEVTVHCYGVSWYSGWGLTNDYGLTDKCQKLLKKVLNRRKCLISQFSDELTKPVHKSHSSHYCFQLASVEQLFFAAYLDYSHYVDPASKQACSIDTAIDWLISNRYWHNQLKGKLKVYEFSRWKIPFVRAFVHFPKTELTIKPKPNRLSQWKQNLPTVGYLQAKQKVHKANFNQPLLVWGLKTRQQLMAQIKTSEIKVLPTIYCMEDGFIRSNGLGATLLAPLSVVIDSQGIYYNATEPSDLETLIKNCPKLTEQQIRRINSLQQRLLAQKVSKYNVGKDLVTQHLTNKGCWLKEVRQTNNDKILIVGQVEDDLSVQYCGSLIKTNAELIKRVSQDHPDAYLIYKPHPDVEAGLRTGKVDASILNLVHAVADDIAMPDCLELIDAVHTISSLTGFEALLRGKSVTCYGLPFYAGWGLTTDLDADLPPQSHYLQRRQHDSKRTLQQLVYASLIQYPLYRLPEGYGLAQVEQVIDYLYGTDTTKPLQKTTKKQSLINHGKQKLMQNRLKILTLFTKK